MLLRACGKAGHHSREYLTRQGYLPSGGQEPKKWGEDQDDLDEHAGSDPTAS